VEVVVGSLLCTVIARLVSGMAAKWKLTSFAFAF
jgi:hypothetical protein